MELALAACFVVLLASPMLVHLIWKRGTRPKRTVPPEIAAQIRAMPEFKSKSQDFARMITQTKPGDPYDKGYKLVDLDTADGSTYTRVWVVQDTWPTISLRRRIRGFDPDQVVAARPHQPPI